MTGLAARLLELVLSLLKLGRRCAGGWQERVMVPTCQLWALEPPGAGPTRYDMAHLSRITSIVRTRKCRQATIAGLAAIGVLTVGCQSARPSESSPRVVVAPGVARGQIVIGSFQPLTGAEAAGYDQVAPAAAAYFRYVNANGGVYGRSIVFTYLNDHSSVRYAPSDARQLVLGDAVFAVFNDAGTAEHLAVAQFLNSERVPDVFAASGCECWNSPSLPYTYGWQLASVREGKILGYYIARHFTGQKVAFLYQDDAFGRGGVRGLSYEIPGRQVTARVGYPSGDATIGPLAARLKATRARVVVSFASPAVIARLRLDMAALSYDPQFVVSGTAADAATITGLLRQWSSSGSGASLANGIITDSGLPAPGDVSNSWVALFRKIHDKYLRAISFDGKVMSGMAAAYAFTEALFQAGPNPTRADLLGAISTGLAQGPAVAPLAYGTSGHDGMTGAWIGQIASGGLTPLTGVLITGPARADPVTPYDASQPRSPASGIPLH